MKKRIIAIHLLNDRSGSPLILRQALETLQQENEVILYTSTPSGDGFLNDIDNVAQRTLFYKWSSNKFITLFYFLLSQVLILARMLFVLRKQDTLYVNTLLPFGAALAGYLRGVTVIYHVQEVSLKPAALKGFLFSVANLTARRVLFVSHYVAGHYNFTRPEKRVIHNSLPESFIERAKHISRINFELPFTVTMLCSMKAYKGIYHFISVARKMKDLRFVLVLNTSQKEVDTLRKMVDIPDNCIIHPSQSDTVPFYEQAHVVCNLSKPDGWVETFGMTLLEAMHCGRPVICPPVGGVLEVVEDGIQGFTIDSNEEGRICNVLRRLSEDLTYYVEMAQAAFEKSEQFDRYYFEKDLTDSFRFSKNAQKMNAIGTVFPKSGKVEMVQSVHNQPL